MKLSILIPLYNCEDEIISVLTHLENQLSNIPVNSYEIIIRDDCSNDNTYEFCKNFYASNKKNNVTLNKNVTNVGIYKNWNALIFDAQGDYILFQCQDDYIINDFISEALWIINEKPEILIVFPHSRVIFKNSKIVHRYETCHKIGTGKSYYERFLNTINCKETVAIHGLINRSALLKTKLFDGCVGSDHLLLNELSLLGNFVSTNKIGLDYYENDDKPFNNESTKKIIGNNKTFYESILILKNIQTILKFHRGNFWVKIKISLNIIKIERGMLRNDFVKILRNIFTIS
ncbi:glycosyltransferase family 2 protein [Polynucleobacter sp. 73C-SIWE]|uniref:glycosyltransferase family 2 protein n=1 Tax=Polynucleobacter sp. 73C-SIWE TaxID=2689098 RepID=UPI001C0B5191|nr:glycosyltransferase family 2 protein [Polynucleobacter sp. 73C-SIWE]MBU3578620.1 glycosyltransferase family 2 protein [Polynucleobacter sp. 73C-SIWE]